MKNKTECLNPRSGRAIQIDSDTYSLFSKAIYHVLYGGKELTFEEITDGIDECFRENKTRFEGSVGWYAITVKNDMESRGLIEAIESKGRKLNRLTKQKPAKQGKADR
jgi:hypothetical protein